MKLVLRGDDGRERVVQAELTAKHLTEKASPALVDAIQWEMEKLLRVPEWSTTEILDSAG